jgi:transcriptional regulator with GAF, ATPase, and Fis domain
MQRRGQSGQPTKVRRGEPKARKAATSHVSASDLHEDLDQRTRERDEALEQLTATSEILKLISNSFYDLQPVFETIGKRSEKLCAPDISVVSIVDGDAIRLVSVNGVTKKGAEALRRAFPMRLDDESVTARSIRTCTVCHVPDVLTDSQYAHKDVAQVSGYRGCLSVPMVRDRQVVGAIFVARMRPGFFSNIMFPAPITKPMA